MFLGGDDFKSGQTKIKSVLVDFLVLAGLKLREGGREREREGGKGRREGGGGREGQLTPNISPPGGYQVHPICRGQQEGYG